MLTALDLFAGAGGATQGLKDAGYRVLAAVEEWSDAVRTFSANHPEVGVLERDIRCVEPRAEVGELRRKAEYDGQDGRGRWRPLRRISGRQLRLRGPRAGELRGPVGKTAVVVGKDRETGKVAVRVIEETDSETLNSFVDEHASPDAEVYTDGATVYKGRENHEAVAHSIGEYVRGQVHTNGVESFRSMPKRGYMGVDHRMSPKHLQRYVNEFAGRHNILDLDTLDQMAHVVAGMVGRRLLYRDVTADNGRSRVAT